MLPVLKASLHDVRYFSALLRGVNFVNRATVTVTKRGFIVVAEEARTLLGTAFIFSGIFDEYEYHAESEEGAEPRTEDDDDDDDESAAFEIPLNTLIECLNIFGTAASSNYSGAGGKFTRWKKVGDESDGDEGDDRRNKGVQQFFGGGAEKRTGMRMSYAGAGYPLTLLLAEDASGPTTTCEISTYDAEPHLELPFENDKMILKIILKSSWLRDALSELDPSCEKLTFIGNPPPEGQSAAPGPIRRARNSLAPMLRIHASGTFGSTEMDYPNDRDVLESFECTRTVSFSYRFGHISRTLRALQSSTKTSLRIDDDGLLSLQFLMPAPSLKPGKRDEATDAFIEYRCLALDDDN